MKKILSTFIFVSSLFAIAACGSITPSVEPETYGNLELADSNGTTYYYYNSDNWDRVICRFSVEEKDRTISYEDYMIETEQPGWNRYSVKVDYFTNVTFKDNDGHSKNAELDKNKRYYLDGWRKDIREAYINTERPTTEIYYFVYLNVDKDNLAGFGYVDERVYSLFVDKYEDYNGWYKVEAPALCELACIYDRKSSDDYQLFFDLKKGLFFDENKVGYESMRDVYAANPDCVNFTLNFYNPAWDKAYAFVYNSLSEPETAFPGFEMTKGEYNWFTCTIKGAYNKLIFTNGTEITSELLIQNNRYYFNGWYDTKEEAMEANYETGVFVLGETRTYYVYNSFDSAIFPNLHVSAYSTESKYSEVKAVTPVEGHENWYTFTASSECNRVIFMGVTISSITKTDSITIDGEKSYYYGGWYSSFEEAEASN